ncbi:MAG: HAD-IA family hydrolase [Acaryochloridaceae cyanobacterium RL_2_7]|nr:HAD-IA family hydrolase [Acaryochloridaceae cyanobacterium RL_2_7]
MISNFDSRLEPVLIDLELKQYFSSITISTHVGAAKPDGAIFEKALANYEISPCQALHIGDQWVDDFQGAQLAGIHGVLLLRSSLPEYFLEGHQLSEEQVIHRLDQLSW